MKKQFKQFKTLAANDGYYLTQSDETDLTKKIFITSIRGLNLKEDNWVECTEEYAQEVLEDLKFLKDIGANIDDSHSI